jgi:hypothetical protein
MASIKFLENISFDDDIEIQLGDPASPDGIIKGNSQGLTLSTPISGSLLKLECNASNGFIAFGYGGTNYFFFMNSITGQTEIRHSNVKVFETLSGGVKVTGNIQVTGGFKDSSGDLGTSGQVLSSTGSGTNWIDAGTGGTPAGSNQEIQFNNSGSFGADSNFRWDGTNLNIGTAQAPEATLGVSGSITSLSAPVSATRMYLTVNSTNGILGATYGNNFFFTCNASTSTVELRFNNSKVFETVSGGTKVTGSLQVTGTFKDSSGDTGTSGQVLSSTGSGTNWIAAGGGGTPAGSNTQIQFNDSGSFGADSNLTWDGTDLDINGNIIGGNTSVLHMRQIKVDDQLVSSSIGNFGKGSRLFSIGTQSLAAGRVYALTSNGWSQSDASAINLLSTGLLGVGTSTASGAGLVVEGVVYVSSDPGGTVGDVIYLDTAAGNLTNDVSGFAEDEVVRIVGYKVGTNKVYFSPSKTWLEVSE